MARNVLKFYTTKSGSVYAKLFEGGIFRKYEKQRDRLHFTGDKDHALDIDLVEEARKEGASVFEILETGMDGEKRLFRISMDDLQTYGRKITLCGRDRLRINLARFDLILGPEEVWRAEDRAELLQAETRQGEVKEIRHEQGMLFSDQEKDYWQTRLVHET